MSWMELSVRVECPHCGYEDREHVEFNTEAGDQSGINSDERKVTCSDCCGDFYFKARVDFAVEATHVSRKPFKKGPAHADAKKPDSDGIATRLDALERKLDLMDVHMISVKRRAYEP